MGRLTTEGEERYRQFIDILSRAETIGRRIVDGDRSLAFGERPWEYVATIATSTAARLAISGVSLSLSGYPDSAAILTRTLWESRLRLTWMCDDRLPRSLRFLWADAESEISAIEAMPDDAIPDRTAVLPVWIAYRERIVQHGLRLGASESEIAKRLPTASTLAKEQGEKTRHDTWYARHSVLAHGRSASLVGFLGQAKVRAGENGIIFPTRLYRLNSLHSLGSETLAVLMESARLIHDHELEEEAHRLAHEIADEFVRVRFSDTEEVAIARQIKEGLESSADGSPKKDERPVET